MGKEIVEVLIRGWGGEKNESLALRNSLPWEGDYKPISSDSEGMRKYLEKRKEEILETDSKRVRALQRNTSVILTAKSDLVNLKV